MDTDQDIERQAYLEKHSLTPEAYTIIENERQEKHLASQDHDIKRLMVQVNMLQADIVQMRKRFTYAKEDALQFNSAVLNNLFEQFGTALNSVLLQSGRINVQLLDEQREIHHKQQKLEKSIRDREMQEELSAQEAGSKPAWKNREGVYLGVRLLDDNPEEPVDVYYNNTNSDSPLFTIRYGNGQDDKYSFGPGFDSHMDQTFIGDIYSLAKKRGFLPTWEHDCSIGCEFLGGWKPDSNDSWAYGTTHIDLYFHDQGTYVELIARCGDEPENYYSGNVGSYEIRNPAILEAKRRYQERQEEKSA